MEYLNSTMLYEQFGLLKYKYRRCKDYHEPV